MVKNKGTIFKTSCGLFANPTDIDDLSYMGKTWTWVHCPFRKWDCGSRIPYNDFCHCGLEEKTSELYDYENSVEKLMDEKEKERHTAIKTFVDEHDFRWCRAIGYDFDKRKVTVNSNIIETCLECPRCNFIKESQSDTDLCKIVCDVTITKRFNKGDLFGWQTETQKIERFNLLSSGMDNKYFSKPMCERYIKNNKWLYRRIENVQVNGLRWGTLRDIFLKYHKQDYFNSLGWMDGEITVVHGDAYLTYKNARKTANMRAIAKAEKAAKQEHRREVYRKRIRTYLKRKNADDYCELSEAFKESTECKLSVLSKKFPEMYEEELSGAAQKREKSRLSGQLDGQQEMLL